jgi:hypothetical protein
VMVGTEPVSMYVHERPATGFYVEVVTDSWARAGCESGTPRGQRASCGWPGAECQPWACAALAGTSEANASVIATMTLLSLRVRR